MHCLAFCDAPHTHHTGVEGAFTDLEKRFPRLAPAIERLREEHRTVAQALRGIEALLGGLSARAAAGEAETPRAELARLAAGLDAHFDHDEQHLLPALTGEDHRPPAA
ncbi:MULTISPECIES: hemerythrin domain-containing protein [unclassified Streptomyces]|uniref:hemerythrin domain-containing protein n=1 Tax=unclassified Streptomyces TaxID=2593676 RepID=UPI0015E16C7B|nr:hemerythrin domain-containing protein [Streptomyces sp. SM10]